MMCGPVSSATCRSRPFWSGNVVDSVSDPETKPAPTCHIGTPGRCAHSVGIGVSVGRSSTFTLVMVRPRLSAADILHRGVVLSLVGVCVWGIGTGILVHRDTLRMGRG